MSLFSLLKSGGVDLLAARTGAAHHLDLQAYGTPSLFFWILFVGRPISKNKFRRDDIQGVK